MINCASGTVLRLIKSFPTRIWINDSESAMHVCIGTEQVNGWQKVGVRLLTVGMGGYR